MPYIEAAGARLHVEEHGDGYPIIFVHELGSDLRQWEDQVRYFSRAYRCIAYNARGYPPSDVPEDPTAYGWERSVDDIAAVMNGLGVDHAHVVGLSMGAYAALQFGLRHPQRVSAMSPRPQDRAHRPPVVTPGCERRRSWRAPSPSAVRPRSPKRSRPARPASSSNTRIRSAGRNLPSSSTISLGRDCRTQSSVARPYDHPCTICVIS